MGTESSLETLNPWIQVQLDTGNMVPVSKDAPHLSGYTTYLQGSSMEQETGHLVGQDSIPWDYGGLSSDSCITKNHPFFGDSSVWTGSVVPGSLLFSPFSLPGVTPGGLELILT